MVSPVAFIIGNGSNVGKSVAHHFKKNGYAVAVGSRNPDLEAAKQYDLLPITIDSSNLTSVQEAFSRINTELGPPNVVVYNCSSMTPPPDLADPLSLPAETFTRDVGMGLGMYYAAQQALSGFRSEKTQGLPKAFIVTGNGLPHIPPMYPKFVGLGMQKQMEFYMAELFSKSYANEDARFYYASLSSCNGGIPPPAVFAASGAAHGQVYWNLANQKEQGNWDHRFTIDGEKIDDSLYALDLDTTKKQMTRQ